MTKLKEFKQQNPNLDFSIIDVLEKIDISKTNKFLPMFVNLINNNSKIFNNEKSLVINDDRHGYYKNKFYESSNNNDYIVELKSIIISYLFDGWQNIQEIEKFMEFHQKNTINNIDVNQIKSFSEISSIVGLCEIKSIDKKFSKMVIKHYEDDNWLIVRPLTWESSKKYGAGTKWCTTNSNNPSYFYDYSENAALIYCINLKTGYKVAFHEPLAHFRNNSDVREFAFWDAQDNKIDSLTTELPIDLLFFLKNMERKTNKETSTDIWETSMRESMKILNESLLGNEIEDEEHLTPVEIIEEESLFS